jgi:hypothetical protein
MGRYVDDLTSVIDMQAIARAALHRVDPLGPPVACGRHRRQHGVDLTITNDR